MTRRRRPTHCPCGGRYALDAELRPSTRCLVCAPLETVREKTLQTLRVRAKTDRLGRAGQHVRERMRQERAA